MYVQFTSICHLVISYLVSSFSYHCRCVMFCPPQGVRRVCDSPLFNALHSAELELIVCGEQELLVGGLEHDFDIFPFSWEFHGISSSQLTNSYIFQRGLFQHQPGWISPSCARTPTTTATRPKMHHSACGRITGCRGRIQNGRRL